MDSRVLNDFGYKGFPLPAGQKTPPPTGWQRLAGNVEIPTGSNYGIVTEDFVLADIDRGELVKRFLEKYRQSITMLVGTPRGGVHAYFAGQARNAQHDGWDIRGTGGYVVGPGSVVGKPYRLLSEFVPKSQLKPVPQELIAVRKTLKEREVTTEAFRRITRAKAYAATVTCVHRKGTASNSLFRLCCWMRDIGMTPAEAFAVLLDWNQTNCFQEDSVTPYPWSQRQLSHKIDDAWGSKK